MRFSAGTRWGRNVSHLAAMCVLLWSLIILRSSVLQHFDPDSVLFEPQHRMDVILSDIGIAMMFVVLGVCIHFSSFATVLQLYIIPWFLTNHWYVHI